MKINEFDFELPTERIARFPAEKRGKSKLMVVDRKTGNISHHIFDEIVDVLPDKYQRGKLKYLDYLLKS